LNLSFEKNCYKFAFPEISKMADSDSAVSKESSVKYSSAEFDLKSLSSVYVNENPIFIELKNHI
jgi:hypothetical protein